MYPLHSTVSRGEHCPMILFTALTPLPSPSPSSLSPPQPLPPHPLTLPSQCMHPPQALSVTVCSQLSPCTHSQHLGECSLLLGLCEQSPCWQGSSCPRQSAGHWSGGPWPQYVGPSHSGKHCSAESCVLVHVCENMHTSHSHTHTHTHRERERERDVSHLTHHCFTSKR